MKKLLLLVATVLVCGSIAIADDNTNNSCWGQDKNGNFYQGQYRTTERTVTTNSNTNTGSSSNSGNRGTSEGSLGTSTKLSGTAERSQSSGSSSNHGTSVTISEKQICVPNDQLNSSNR